MPTYEYACRACGHVFEIVQKMSDDPLVICPECGGALRKVFAAPAISFKGSGFYATDHGKKGKSAEKSREGGGEKKDTASTSKASSEGSSSSPSESSSSSSSSSSDPPSSSGSSSSNEGSSS